jgi:hypothetical protein
LSAAGGGRGGAEEGAEEEGTEEEGAEEEGAEEEGFGSTEGAAAAWALAKAAGVSHAGSLKFLCGHCMPPAAGAGAGAEDEEGVVMKEITRVGVGAGRELGGGGEEGREGGARRGARGLLGRGWGGGEVADGCLSEVLAARASRPPPSALPLLRGHTTSPQARQTSPLRARYLARATHL